jgi:hypothetical protein
MASDCVVPIVTLSNIREHPNASLLGLADVLGYQMAIPLVEDQNGGIVRKFVRGKVDEKGRKVPADENTPAADTEEARFAFRYRDGQVCVYFPADTLLPAEWADKFGVRQLLKGKDRDRVGKIKLRGEPSFGLVVDLPDGVDWKVGDNVCDYFGAKKYEPPIRVGCGDAAPYDPDIDPFFDKFTDVQNGRVNLDVFADGEEVIFTEKIHGCLHADTKIMQANGEEIPISALTRGDIVLACRRVGDVIDFVPREVVQVIHRELSSSQKWVRLHFGDRSIVCTEDHLFLTRNGGWISAEKLSGKDDVVEGF